MVVNRTIGSLEHPLILNVEDNISKRYFDWGITPYIFITIQYLVSQHILDDNALFIVATLELIHVILNSLFDIITDEVMIIYDNEKKFTFINVCKYNDNLFAKYICNVVYIFGLNGKNYTMTLDNIIGSSYEKKYRNREYLSSSIIYKYTTDQKQIVYVINEFNTMKFNENYLLCRLPCCDASFIEIN